ncbi:hypothetical protein N7462_004455 [Penicillium macrosclerotiorum]|uniref:uncharacterized protein n=1 Tax=Penicillium macrosclerotiorum TaxID=303699 RepID=UPI002549A9D0|nr:uncharacterized protein N7462_004455 [Penicillium macrosclerotiorum]KAJ5690063.1 hypothetical protein N7462_004455 [Penicillium macrosclerotiorum]
MAGAEDSNKEHPLRGAVICFTSVSLEQRTHLINIAKEMGAIERPDLTSDVTHLLVGATDSPKYKFVARERNDVVVVKPEWIEAVRQSWMLGGDTDIQQLEEQYKLPTFFALTICITGFSEMAFRMKMQETAIENGAEFRKDLTKSVTHLIARNTEGEKYKFATQWNIKVVTVKWFHECLERGMILEEEKYHPMLQLEEQGVGAWNRSLSTTKVQLGKARAGENDGSSDLRPRKKLRRTASTKLVGQNENIWGDIIGAGFGASEMPEPGNDPFDDSESFEKPRPAIQAAKSFASESTFTETLEPRRQPEISAKSLEGFLSGCFFFISGFSSKQKSILRHHLEYNGAQFVESLNEFSRPSIPKTGQGLYVIVPYRTPRSEIPSTDDMAFECEVVTDMWLERCLDARALVPPESHVASTPFPKFPLPGFSGMRICSTGFARINLLHLSKLVDLMGATYDEYLTPKASVLICNDPQTASHEKLRHTAKWGVPSVSADWFWISIQTGQKKPFEPYAVRRPVSQSSGNRENLPTVSVNRKQVSVPTGVPSKDQSIPNDPLSNDKPQKPSSGKSEISRMMPVIGDGFDNEESPDRPKASVPESRSASPPNGKHDQQSAWGPSNQPEREKSPAPAVPSALDTALKGLLQQAQAAKSRQQTEGTSTSDESYPLRRKRKPLLGRAPSHPSVRTEETTNAPSRASSIDTLNDDGLGTALESADRTRDNSLSRTNSRNEQTLSSLFSGAKFDFLSGQFSGQAENEDEENQEPPMTQLDYEDPDAAAMRTEFLRNAGKLTDKHQKADSGLLVGEVKELEDIGWGSRRRTRKHAPKNEE